MAPKRGRGGRGARAGGRGRSEAQDLVGDLRGQGLSDLEVRAQLANMGFKVRKDDLLNTH